MSRPGGAPFRPCRQARPGGAGVAGGQHSAGFGRSGGRAGGRAPGRWRDLDRGGFPRGVRRLSPAWCPAVATITCRRTSRVSRDWPANRVPRHRRTAFGRAGVGTYVAEIVLDLAHRGDVGRVDRDNPGAHRDTVAGDGKRDDGLRIVVSPIIGMPALAQGSNVSPCHWWLATSVCRSRTRPWWRHRTPDRHRARADRRCSRRPPVRSNCRNRRQDRERWLGKSAQYAESPFEKFCLSVNGLRDA